MGTFSLTDVAEKGDEGSGSLCPRGSSALDKQTQSPFLQGQDRENLQIPGFRATGARWRLSWPPAQLERGTHGGQHCVPSSRESRPLCSVGCQPQAGVPASTPGRRGAEGG